MAVIRDEYLLRYSVEGAAKAEAAFRKTGATVQQALQKATDPKASQRNLALLDRELDKAERELNKMRAALQPMPGGLQALDRGARAASAGLMTLSGAVPGLGAVAGMLMGPAGIVAGVALMAGAVARAVPRVVGDISSMADTAERIGVSAESFQELQGAMLLMTEDAAALTPALQRLLEVTGQAAMGVGEGATAFRDMGLEARNAEGQVKTLNELLPDIADRMQAAGSQAERLALAQRLFGEQGRAFVRVLQQGSTGLDDLRQAARDAGIVLNEDMVEGARAADAELKLANARIEAASDKLLLRFEPAVTGALTTLADFVGWLDDGVESLGRFDGALKMVSGEAAVSAREVAALGKMIEELEERQTRSRSPAEQSRIAGLLAMRREQLAMAQTQLALAGPPAAFTPPAAARVAPAASAAPAGRVRPGAVVVRQSSTPAAAAGDADLAAFRRELEQVGQTGTASAQAINQEFGQALGAVATGFSALGISADSAFGRIAGGALTSLQQVNSLLNAAAQLSSLFGGGGGGLGGAAFSLGSSLFGAGTSAEIGASLGLTTGNFGGAAALGSGVSAAGALGVGGFATGGEFTVGGTGGRDRQLVQFLATPGETVRVEPPAGMRGGGGGVNVAVNVQNSVAGVEVEPRQSRGADGSVQLDFLVRRVKQELTADVRARKGDFSQVLRSEFAGRGG